MVSVNTKNRGFSWGVASTLESIQPAESNIQFEESEFVYFFIQKTDDDNEKKKMQKNFISFMKNELKDTYDKST